MKKLIVSTMALLCLTVSSVADAATWKLAHRFPVGAPEDISANLFAQKVNEYTNGEIEITIFPNSQLGDWTVATERVSLGVIDLTLSAQNSQSDKRIALYYFPSMFQNLDEVKLNMTKGHPFRTAMDELLIGQNLYPLAQLPGFFAGIGMKRLPEKWDDVNSDKQMKVRCASDPVLVESAAMQNYLVTTIPFSDTYTALQTGVVEAVFGTGVLGNYDFFRDVIKYYVPNNEFFQFFSLLMNHDKWKSLDDKTKEAVLKAAQEAEDFHYANYYTEEAKYTKLITEAGVEVVEIPQAYLNQLYEKATKEAWPKLAKLIDEEYINNTLKLIEKLPTK